MEKPRTDTEMLTILGLVYLVTLIAVFNFGQILRLIGHYPY